MYNVHILDIFLTSVDQKCSKIDNYKCFDMVLELA